MHIRITLDLDDSLVDANHPTGLTNEGFEALFEVLSPLGDDIKFEIAPEEDA